MPAIISLPVELITRIIGLALGQRHDGHTIGYNAAWSMPPSNNLASYVSRYPNPSQSIEDTPNAISDATPDEAGSEKPVGFYTMAKVLRLVNRTFSAIVTPSLYEEMNLLVHSEDVTKLGAAVDYAILPYAQHIRSLYLYADSQGSAASDELEEYSTRFLSNCVNLKSLGLYFQGNGIRDLKDWTRLREAVVTLVEQGNISSIGFYSEYVLTSRAYVSYHMFLDGLIHSLSESELARNRIKHLDLAVFLIPGPVHNKIRAKFPNLESLTMRMSFRGRPGGWGDREGEGMWFQLNNLTRLQFYCCEGAYAPEVPEIVSFFPALRELLISRCGGGFEQEETGPHEEDWHLDPEALHRTHKPLDWLHIELMNDWQIRDLGVIPTKTLILTFIMPADFLEVVEEDMHLFPGLEVLRIQDRFPDEVEQDMFKFSQFAEARDVKVFRDAKPLYQPPPEGANIQSMIRPAFPWTQ